MPLIASKNIGIDSYSFFVRKNPDVSTIEFIAETKLGSATAPSSTQTVTLPTGTIAGDLCLAYFLSYDNDNDYLVDGSRPSGFTNIYSAGTSWLVSSSTYMGLNVSYKVLTDADITTGSVSFTTNAGGGTVDQLAIILHTYRTNRPISTITLSSVNSGSGNSLVPTQTLLTAGITNAVLACGLVMGNLDNIATGSINMPSIIGLNTGGNVSNTSFSGPDFNSMRILVRYGTNPLNNIPVSNDADNGYNAMISFYMTIK